MKFRTLGSGSSGNCYFLEAENETLIIECGLPYKNIINGLNYNISNVVGCLMSHEHKDHSKAAKYLIKKGIDIYSSEGTFKALGIESYRAKVIKSQEQIKIGNFTVLPFTTQHDAAEPLGFLIYHNESGKILYITDSYYCQYKFSGLNHILIECNYSWEILNKNMEQGIIHPSLKNRILKSHFSLDNVKGFLKASSLDEVRNIVLIHLSDNNSDAGKFKAEIEKMTGKPTYVAAKDTEIEVGR